MSSIKDQTNSY